MKVKSKVPEGTKCPRCKAEHIVSMGKVATTQGKKRRYKCNECAKTFYIKREELSGKR